MVAPKPFPPAKLHLIKAAAEEALAAAQAACAGAGVATERKVEANRRNARLSTGPRTPEGKARSSGNARSHGLFSKVAVLPDEDPAEYAKLLSELMLVH